MHLDLTTLKTRKLLSHDYDRLVELHTLSMPESLISFFGQRYILKFYRYIADSPQEFLLTHKDHDEITAACILSLSPKSLSRRLILKTPLLWRTPFAVCKILLHFRALLFTQFFSMSKFHAKQSGKKTLTEKDTDPEMTHIFTALNARNQGLGTLMLEKCEDLLIDKGFNQYIVKTWDDDLDPIVKFYKKKGFVLRNQFWRGGIYMRTMEKILTGGKSLLNRVQ